MMQAGKDYIVKDAEYESPRALYLRELLKSVAAQAGWDDAMKAIETEKLVDVTDAAKEGLPARSTNQTKPTLKLK